MSIFRGKCLRVLCRCLYCAFVIVVAGTIKPADALEYEVEGTIEQTIENLDGKPPLVTRSDFTVYVRDCSWLIQTRPAGSTNRTSGVVEIGATNDTEIFQLNIARDSTNATNRPLSIAQVYSNNAPVDYLDSGVTGHLWLMFASGCQLQTNSDSLLTPVYDVSVAAPGPNPNLKREAKWELIGALGSTPSKVIFITSPLRRTTNALYLATGKTNAGNVTIASGFVFEQYLPTLHRGSEVIPAHARKRAVGTVTELRPYCTLDTLLPAPIGRTVVGDLRIKMPKEGTNVPPTVVYVYQTNQGWLSTNEAKEVFVANRERYLAAIHRKRVTPLEIGLLVALLLAPVLWFNFRPKPKSATAKAKVTGKRR